MPTLFIVFLVSGLQLISASISREAKCGACHMVIKEIEDGVAAVGKDKKISIGSFRVDPNGDQLGLNEVSYARSEIHINDLVERICDKATKYVLVEHPETHKKVYWRKNGPYKTTTEDLVASANLKRACHDFMDDNEDDLITFSRSHHNNPALEFCHKEKRVCSIVDLTEFPPNFKPPSDNTEESLTSTEKIENEEDSDTDADMEDKDEL